MIPIRRGGWIPASLLVIAVSFLLEWTIGTWVRTPAARWTDPELGWVHRPSSRHVQSYEGFAVRRANRDGLLDDELRRPRAARRAVLLGDSYAEALQVARGRSFAEVTESLDPDLEIVNAGMGAQSPHFYGLFLPGYLRRFEPDLVIVQLD